MDRVEGRIPPDVMPYTFEGWVLEATPEERRQLQDASVAVLAGIHGIDLDAVAAAGTDTAFLLFHDTDPAATPLRRHVDHWRNYYDWMRGDGRLPLADATFAWLETNWPDEEGPAVLSWGDARIGNMIFDGFTPAAVLDWEMAGVGPAGIDVGWMMFLHTFFQDIAEQFDLAGLPEMFRPDDVLETYRLAGGSAIPDLGFFTVYAALRHALVMARVHERRVYFGEVEPVADPDDAIMHRARLEQLIS
jgi:aminoglycoside phosphotransferase (APT) family kinase protein